MKSVFFLLILIALVSCNSQKAPEQAVKLNSSSVMPSEPKVDPFQKTGSNALKAEDDFSDLKELDKKDESCDSPEELEKKLLEKAQKPALLQGGDEGCSVE